MLLSDPSRQTWPEDVQTLLYGLTTDDERILLGNDGTALRFLTAYYASRPGKEVVLDGCARLRERPMAQLIEALRELGADISCELNEGFAPLHIRGRVLTNKKVTICNPLSSQFVSALLLIGVEVQTNSQSPYIQMTRSLLQSASAESAAKLPSILPPSSSILGPSSFLEPDWSAAAFWLERQALGLIKEPLEFPGLRDDSLQGDRVARDLFAAISCRKPLTWDFSSCPDLYPAAAVTCHLLGIPTAFTGTESLVHKESNRLQAVAEGLAAIDASRVAVVKTYGDHRIAMAFLAAGFRVDDETCCRKSYPDFVLQLRGITRVVPRRGINDEGKGKKWALHRLIPQVQTEWVWLTDDDVRYPHDVPPPELLSQSDMIILPLRMETDDSLLGRLQMLEYTAIQALTMETAKRGHAVMCSGANLLVRREAWLACEAELHPEIASGDDMFLLETMKRRGMRVHVYDGAEATITPAPSLRALLRQRMRWAGKAPHYRDSDILLCGAWTVVSNVLAALCLPWLLLKWLSDTALIATRKKITTRLLLETLLLTIVYPWYMLICLVGGFFRKSW